MRLQIFHVDAFTDQVFSGNPAAVCPLQHWLKDETMQKIAMENMLAETAFFIPVAGGFAIRWFTPDIEMDLCGHATLASAHVIGRHLFPGTKEILFQSRSGELKVEVGKKFITLNFPARDPEPAQAPQIILDGFPIKPTEVLKARDYMLVYEDEDTVRNMKPNRTVLDQINLDPGGIILTAPGKDVDFVSRFFTTQSTNFEDPVTGSAHCTLIPYWSKRLDKKSLEAFQVSARGGRLSCANAGERVLIAGEAVTFMEGWINL